MKNKYSKIIDKVIASLDWDSIFEVNKCFKHGVGEGISAIPGVKRKTFSDGITKNDIKNELKGLLKYVVENDYAELIYSGIIPNGQKRILKKLQKRWRTRKML